MKADLKLKPVDNSPFDINGNFLDENWWHLYIPTKEINGKIMILNKNSVKLIRLIKGLGIESKVQLISDLINKNLSFLSEELGEKTNLPRPYLEVVYGCETSALVWYTNFDEIVKELSKIKGRMDYLRNCRTR